MGCALWVAPRVTPQGGMYRPSSVALEQCSLPCIVLMRTAVHRFVHTDKHCNVSRCPALTCIALHCVALTCKAMLGLFRKDRH
eukprot:5317380-Pyramimonas_sp.AAC.1